MKPAPRRRRSPLSSAGIIAAGNGARLAGRHPQVPKPLVPVSGRPLCHWVVASLAQAGISDFAVIINSRGQAVRESLLKTFPGLRWTFLEKDTASSWESFRLVAQCLARRSETFLMSTADSLVAPMDVARFAREIDKIGAPAGLALTDFIDDEKPLWADIGANGLVSAIGEKARERRFATAGLYYLTAQAARRMPAAADFRSLREYLGLLVADGGVAGIPVAKAVDVDRPQDVSQAEAFLKAVSSW